jgi:hypothetical protein
MGLDKTGAANLFFSFSLGFELGLRFEPGLRFVPGLLFNSPLSILELGFNPRLFGFKLGLLAGFKLGLGFELGLKFELGLRFESLMEGLKGLEDGFRLEVGLLAGSLCLCWWL